MKKSDLGFFFLLLLLLLRPFNNSCYNIILCKAWAGTIMKEGLERL